MSFSSCQSVIGGRVRKEGEESVIRGGKISVEMDNSWHCFERFYLGGGPQFLKVVLFIDSFRVQGIALGA